MSVFIFNIDTPKLYVQFFILKWPQDLYQQTISVVCSFIKVLIFMNKTLSGHLRELKKQRKCPVGLSQQWPWLLTGAVAHESFSFQSLSYSSNRVW